jgi:ATP-dependent protease ClpP protease subunit
MNRGLPILNYSVRNQSSTVLEIAIDGQIVDASTEQFYKDYWGDDTSVSFKSFRDTLNTAIAGGVTVINGTINSPGGHVTEAMAIHDYLVEIQNKGVTVNMKGQGIVASAATYILMASRNSSLTENSWLMIHNVSGFAYGDVNEVENQAKTLRKFNDTVRDFYATATGQPKETISGWMNKETWLTATEAKEKGFVKATSGAAQFTNTIDPKAWLFQNMDVLAAYNSSTSNPPTMDFAKITEAITNGFNSLSEKLGLTNKTEGAADALAAFSNSIVNAVKESIPTSESIQEMVTNAMAESTKVIPENFQKAIDAAVANAAKNVVTNEDLKKLEGTLTDAIANMAGGSKPKNTAPPTASKYEHEGVSYG